MANVSRFRDWSLWPQPTIDTCQEPQSTTHAGKESSTALHRESLSCFSHAAGTTKYTGTENTTTLFREPYSWTCNTIGTTKYTGKEESAPSIC